jgi:hypothetical protein
MNRFLQNFLSLREGRQSWHAPPAIFHEALGPGVVLSSEDLNLRVSDMELDTVPEERAHTWHPVHCSQKSSNQHVARTMRGHFLWQLGKRRINFREQRRCLEGFSNLARLL